MDISISSLGAIMKNTTMNILVLPFRIHPHAFLLGMYLGDEMLGHGICIFSNLVDNVNVL